MPLARAAWRSVLQALGVAAGDASPAVVSAALDALQPVTHALYRKCAALCSHRLISWIFPFSARS
jgi:hypothetical protein